MKNYAGLFLLLVLSLFSCNRIAQLREPIEKLAVQWENTTQVLNELNDQVAGKMEQANERLAQYEATDPSGPFADLTTPADITQQEVEEQLARLHSLQNELTEALGNWHHESDRVKALQNGLAEGKLPKEATNEIDALSQQITEQKSRLTNWEVQFETIEADLQAVLEQLLSAPAEPSVQ